MFHRCSLCDYTSSGQFTHTEWSSTGRSFYPDKYQPWLLACSECQPYMEPTRDYLEDELEDGEVENINEEWDDQ